MAGISILRKLLMREAVKDTANMGSGIMTINRSLKRLVDKDVDNYLMSAKKQGVDIDNMSEQQLKYMINLNKRKSNVISQDDPRFKGITEALLGKKSQVIPFPQKRSFGQEVDDMIKKGDVKVGRADKTKPYTPSKSQTEFEIQERIMSENAKAIKRFKEKFRGPVKEKKDMGPLGRDIDVEVNYSASLDKPEFFGANAKNIYGETAATGSEFIKKERERILNTINRKNKEMVPTTHSNYKLLKKSLQDQEDALEAIKITEDLGGNQNMFDFLRTKNIADYKSKPLKRSDYVKIDEPEDMADGGVAGLLGERQNFAMGRRAFMKLLGGAAAGIGAAKAGLGSLFKAGKPIATKIVTPNVAGKPVWFDDLVNKVIKEGDDVTKQFATKDREIVHATKIGDDEMVTVTRDLDEGAIRVEYNSSDNMYEDTVQLQYKKPLPDENNPRPAAEFDVAESGPVGRRYGPDDFEIEIDEVGGNKIEDLTSDVSKLKEYATGKKPTIREFIQNKKRRDKAKDISAGGESEADEVIRRQGDYDYANGGLANMLGE